MSVADDALRSCGPAPVRVRDGDGHGRSQGVHDHTARGVPAPARGRACAGLERGVCPRGPAADRQPAGRPVHGLRCPLLPRSVPAGQSDPRVERPRLPRRLAGGERSSARHEQLPRVHRAVVPRTVRGGLRPGDQPTRGDHQERRGRHRRPRLGGRAHPAASAGPALGQDRGDRRFGTHRSRRRAAAHAGRAHRRRVRGVGPGRRTAAVRDPRVQDGEAAAEPEAGPDAGGGDQVPNVDRHRHRSRGPRPRVPLRRRDSGDGCHRLA